MLPDSAFPGALPLSREAALDLLDRLDEFNATGGTFLTFVMLPLEERIGEYRFAGASRSLAEAVRRVEEFADAMHLHNPGRPGGLLRVLLEDNTGAGYDSEYEYPREAPIELDVPHRLVLCVQYGAPYDNLGACVLEVPALAGSAYDGRPPETDFPEEWREAVVEWVLEQGGERFGPVPPAVEAAIRDETRPDVWAGWRRRWAEFSGWEGLVPGSSSDDGG
jgi:hypothetical protein